MRKLLIQGSCVGMMVLAAAAMPLSAGALAVRGDDPQPTMQVKKEAEVKSRLDDIKLKSCKNREKSINNILARVADRGQKQIDLFSSIATKTQTFYQKNGKTLANYDKLVADINAKKAAAQAEVDKTKSMSASFACDGTDPKGAVSTFKESLQPQAEAIKAYKTSVRNLIVGVKSVQGTTSAAKPEGTNQ